MQIWHGCIFMCMVGLCYGSDGESQEDAALSNGYHHDKNLQEIKGFLAELDYTIYNLSQFRAKVHQVLDLEMFHFDQMEGRTLGDMLYVMLREQRMFNDLLNAQDRKLKEGITQREVKDLITQAIDGRFCNLENRMNAVEKHLKKLNDNALPPNN